jgi:hypothetical protein
MTGQWIICFVFSLPCVVLSAPFASAETAFMNLQRMRLKHLQASHVHSTLIGLPKYYIEHPIELGNPGFRKNGGNYLSHSFGWFTHIPGTSIFGIV